MYDRIHEYLGRRCAIYPWGGSAFCVYDPSPNMAVVAPDGYWLEYSAIATWEAMTFPSEEAAIEFIALGDASRKKRPRIHCPLY